MMKKFLVFIFTLLFSFQSFAKVAVVKILKGDVKVKIKNEMKALKMDEWVEEGMIIVTGEKSFVKLVFVDKSSMNVGPKSEMKIEKFNGKEASVFEVVKGQIRSNVSKDYLQNPEKDKSKLFIKTSNAVMGVRGTDFMLTSNGKNTSTVLFEGEIVFNSLPQNTNNRDLEDVVNQGVKIQPGEFSVVKEDLPQPTIPSVLNLKQRELLEKNENFDSSSRSPASTSSDKKSIVPEGLNGETVSNDSSHLKSELKEVATSDVPTPSSDAQGFVDGDKVKPANGSFVHLESGTIVPPPADSVLDPNTNSFIPSSGNGTVADDGSFVPPEGVEITPEGKVLITVTQPDAPPGATPKVVEVEQMAPVVSNSSASLANVVEVVQNAPNPTQITQLTPPPTVQPTITTTTYTSPAQTNYTTSTPTETQIINQITRGRLNINIIDR